MKGSFTTILISLATSIITVTIGLAIINRTKFLKDIAYPKTTT